MELANSYISVQILPFEPISCNDLVNTHNDAIVSVRMNLANR